MIEEKFTVKIKIKLSDREIKEIEKSLIGGTIEDYKKELVRELSDMIRKAILKCGFDSLDDALLEVYPGEPIRHGRWIMRKKDKLIATGKIGVSEGHILHKSSFDEPFTLQSANIIKIKEHRTVNIPYCSICGNYGDDEYDKTPYCPYCGAKNGKREDKDENN